MPPDRELLPPLRGTVHRLSRHQFGNCTVCKQEITGPKIPDIRYYQPDFYTSLQAKNHRFAESRCTMPSLLFFPAHSGTRLRPSVCGSIVHHYHTPHRCNKREQMCVRLSTSICPKNRCYPINPADYFDTLHANQTADSTALPRLSQPAFLATFSTQRRQSAAARITDAKK